VSNNIHNLPFDITESAFAQIKYLIQEKNIPAEYMLRLGIQGASCSSSGFIIGFDKPTPEDRIYHLDQLSICIRKSQILYIAGITLDYEASDEAVGFVFQSK
jgi:iron-sulfur cluster assembly protein